MMSEREKIVGWLRQTGHHWAADEIENGIHVLWKPEPTIPASEWVKTPSVGH
jgi:catalase (peroxidase I)